MKAISAKSQSGAVSLFVVIFATLLITVVTVGFLRLMINDQRQATNNDLAQSAYDSAQAGIEDAKRVLLRYQKICNTESRSECNSLADKINNAACNGALSIGGVIPQAEGSGTQNTPEIPIQQSTSSNSGDALLDQAYTCVTIDLNTEDYVGSLSSGQSKLVPLVGVDDIGKVKIEWFTSDDFDTSGNTGKVLDYPSIADLAKDNKLPSSDAWKVNRPSLLRAQLMQFGSSGFKLSDFDTSTTTTPTESNANTLFLLPISGTGVNQLSFLDNSQRATDDKGPSSVTSPTAFPSQVECAANLSAGGYACTATITLPKPVNGGDRTAFLRLTPLYNGSHFRVTMQSSSGGSVTFKGVQPEIDSTGRANDLFRRVASRVDLIDTNFPYPEAAVDVSGDFCKDFGVSKDTYYPGGCTP